MVGYFTFFVMLLVIDHSRISNNGKLVLSFILISLFSGLRYGIGYDYFSYYEIIQVGNINTELIPRIFIDIAHNTHFSIFFLLSALWTTCFFILGMRKQNCNFESVYFYVCFPTLLCASFGIVRQAMAYSVIFYLMCHPNYGRIRKMLFITLAFLCHQSSLIAIILLMPLERIGRKTLWVLFIGGVLSGEILVKQLATLNINIPLFEIFKLYISEHMGGGFFLRLLIYGLTIAILINYKKLYKKQMHIFVVYTCIGGALYATFSVNPHMAERFCTFFFSAILIFISSLRKSMKIPKVVFVFSLILIFGLYIYTGHVNSSKEGQWAKYKRSLYYPYQTIFEQ